MRRSFAVIGFTVVFLFFYIKAHAQTITPGIAQGTITGCVGSASFSPNIQRFTLAGNGLTTDIKVTAPADFEVALAANGSYSNSVTLTQTGGVAGGVIYVRSSASAGPGVISGDVVITSAGASTQTVTVNGQVNALPVVNAVTSQTVISGAATTPINFTGTGKAYKWTNSNSAIGITASGTGDIPSFTAINTGNAPVTATLTVTPVPAGFLYTANFNGNSVSVINSGSNTVVAIIPVGRGPFKTLVSPDGYNIYVNNSNANTVSVIDALTNTVIKEITVGTSPVALAITPDGNFLYVCNEGTNNVSVINTITNNVIATIPVNQQPLQFAISPDGGHLYVSNFSSLNISVINTATNLVEATIAGIKASELLTNADGSRLYAIEASGLNRVVVVNTLTNSIFATIPVGDFPTGAAISSDGGEMYVSNQNSNNVSVIDLAGNSVISTIPTGYYGAGTAITPDGNYVYVVNRGAQTVSVIRTSDFTVIKTIPLTGNLDHPVLTQDGSRLYITDDGTNTVHIINTATNTEITNLQVGTNPLLYNNNSISKGNGCSGAPVTFTITVNPSPAAIVTSGAPTAMSTTYGSPSIPSSFDVSGSNLSAPVTVTPPAGFELSTDNVNFSNTLTIGSAGNFSPITVYIRLAQITNAGNYTGNVALSSTNVTLVNVAVPNSTVNPAPISFVGVYTKMYGTALFDYTVYNTTPGTVVDVSNLKNGNTFYSVDLAFGVGADASAAAGRYNGAIIQSNFIGGNGFLSSNYSITYPPIDLVILPAPITITVKDVNKPYGTTITGSPAFTDFNAAGMQNGETITSIAISYGAGAEATAAAGVYAGSVIPSAAAGGTFTASNYTITYVPANINVEAPAVPVITATGTLSALTTEYGTASVTNAFSVSGTNLTAGVLITPPSGFEVSTDNITFASTVLVGGAGNFSNITVYIRLSQITNAGIYSGNITMSSAGANTVNLLMPNSTVSPAPLTIAAVNVNKVYGTTLPGIVNTGSFIITSGTLKNGNTINNIANSYSKGYDAPSAVGTYTGVVIPTAVTGANGFLLNNYNISFEAADIAVSPAVVTIQVNNINKTYGAVLTEGPGFTLFSVSGLQNGETIGSLRVTYSAGAAATDPTGSYPKAATGLAATGSTFSAGNYTINYAPGDVIVSAATLIVTADDKSKVYGTENPALTFTYKGFVNNETEAQLTDLPSITTTALTLSLEGHYPIIVSGGTAKNYTFQYINGDLTITPPATLILPNTFTPNGDGINDTWNLPALAFYPDCTVNIFTRYGTPVFKSIGYKTAWDGKYNGVNVPTGVYYYVVDLKNNKAILSGSLTVLQ